MITERNGRLALTNRLVCLLRAGFFIVTGIAFWAPAGAGASQRKAATMLANRRLNKVSLRGLLILLLVYLVMFLGWTGVGSLMLLAPARFGRFVHDNVGLLPEFGSGDWGKKLIVRLGGAGLLGFAVWFAFRVAVLVRQSS
jgi:hypothetical protein